MRSAEMRLPRRRAAAWAMAASVALVSAEAIAEEDRTVYYQVTYANGRTADLSAAPDTSRGITRVLRITRIQQGLKGYEVMSTGPQSLTLVSRGQTYHVDMVWDGKAWVAPGDEPGLAVVVETAATAPGPDADRQAEAARLQGVLMDLAGRLLESHEKLASSEGKLEPNSPAAAAVGEARRDIRACLRAVLAGAGRLGAASPPAPPPGEPTGQVTAPADAPGPEAGALGAVEPIRQVASLPHRVQVWKLPPAEGLRTYRVAIAHAEAGPAGAFYYVAYADADGDGRPDRLIARSPLAQADRPGEWTEWQFAAADRQVFVGKAWDRSDAVHYHSESVRIDGQWRGLSEETYVSVQAWGVPLHRWGPCYGNIRVRTGPRRDRAGATVPPVGGPYGGD